MDAAHLFDGMFVPTKGKKRDRFIIGPNIFNNRQITFRGIEQLGVDDQSMLLAISAQLGINGNTYVDPPGDISLQLKTDMKVVGEEGSTIAAMKTSLRSLMIDAGYKSPDSGKSLAEARESLDRLRMTNIREFDQETKWDRAANLLSVHFNHASGEVFVAVNPRLTGAIFSGQHIRISLFERNVLETEVAKLMHCWLCSHIRPGKSLGKGNGAYLDTLAPHVWGPNHDSMSKQVRSKRRGILKDSLLELSELTRPLHKSSGWEVEITSSGLVMVNRPDKLPRVEQKKLPSQT
jgi:hypothetical protein